MVYGIWCLTIYLGTSSGGICVFLVLGCHLVRKNVARNHSRAGWESIKQSVYGLNWATSAGVVRHEVSRNWRSLAKLDNERKNIQTALLLLLSSLVSFAKLRRWCVVLREMSAKVVVASSCPSSSYVPSTSSRVWGTCGILLYHYFRDFITYFTCFRCLPTLLASSFCSSFLSGPSSVPWFSFPPQLAA